MNGRDFALGLQGKPIPERERAMLAAADNGDIVVSWTAITIGGRLTVQATTQPLRWGEAGASVFLPASLELQQELADRLDAVLPTPLLLDHKWRASAVRIKPFPQRAAPIDSIAAALSFHDAVEAAIAGRDGLCSCSKSWVLDARNWDARYTNVGINYWWGIPEGLAAPAPTVPSVDGSYRIIQGVKAVLNDLAHPPHNTLHTDYSQLVELFLDACELDGDAVSLRDVLTGKYGADVAALVNHTGVLPGAHHPGVGEVQPVTPPARPPITNPGDRDPAGASDGPVHAWQRWLLAQGYELPTYGADGDHGQETEKATQAYLSDHQLERDGQGGTRPIRVPGPAPRVVGADTAYPITEALIASATKAQAAPPAFWGRYFTRTATSGSVEYRNQLESPIFAAHAIRVLPVARQTNRVGGTAEDGLSDGRANGADLVASFGEDYLASQGAEFFIFLDVEGSGPSRLSADYYSGWTDGLAQASDKVSILPAVYGLPGDAVTWTALMRAMANGAPCRGLWLAHPLVSRPEPVAWDATLVTPRPDPEVPVLLWQYMFPRDGVNVDRNLVNPAIDAENDLLRYLIAPPAA